MTESQSLAPIWQNLPSDPKAAAPALVKAFFDGRKPSTLRTYRQGLEAFAKFIGARSVEEASGILLSNRPGDANKLALDFKNSMINDGYTAATINTRLAAVRSLVALGKMLGISAWDLEVRGVPEEKYRDTSGPGLAKIIVIIKELRAQNDPKSARDAAIIGLMGMMGLREKEVVGLNLEDFEPEAGRLHILGKGKTDQEPLTIPPAISELVTAWLGFRGSCATKNPSLQPLFTHFRQKRPIGRLSGRSVGRITHGLELGNPHSLRHSSITQALNDHNGNVRMVAKFSRHKNINTLLKYDDNRLDLGGKVANALADKLKEKAP